ncbi:Zinc finger CCCH domain-containing protein 44 [Cardamine amara subsp. amara]|uniref:Zinc finger CCCH domain-containing protein 44 n=1 Tax=Cardamine amara subsp. amara TaxID=228776 RepID=A0ABD1AL53_CARAN
MTRNVPTAEECDDWCFVCKDGGDLRLCDFIDCPKVYHESCIDKDIAKVDEDSLICMWHKCYLCKKRANLQCLCCSHAVCQGCATHAEFVRVKGNKGLCNQCHEVVFALEAVQANDAAGTGDNKIDLKDRDTVDCLYFEYWTIIKNQEHITFDDVVRACTQPKEKDVKLRYKAYPKFSYVILHITYI